MDDFDFDKFLAELDAELNPAPTAPKTTEPAEEVPAADPAPAAARTAAPRTGEGYSEPRARTRGSREATARSIYPEAEWEDERPKRKGPVGLVIFLLIVAILLAAALLVLTWMNRNESAAATAPAETAIVEVIEPVEATAPPAASVDVPLVDTEAEPDQDLQG